MMHEQTPIETLREIAKLIAREYFRITHCDIPSDEKFNAMLYFCVRDASCVMAEPVAELAFSFADGCFIKPKETYPYETLLHLKPGLQSRDIEFILCSVLPNYAAYADWKLREMVLESCIVSGFIPEKGRIYPVTPESLKKDQDAHPPYNYYEEESFVR